jgi:hypothetical protein
MPDVAAIRPGEEISGGRGGDPLARAVRWRLDAKRLVPDNNPKLTLRASSRGPPAVPHGLGGWGLPWPSWNFLAWCGGDRQTGGPMGPREMHFVPAWATGVRRPELPTPGRLEDLHTVLYSKYMASQQQATARIYASNMCALHKIASRILVLTRGELRCPFTVLPRIRSTEGSRQ